ncbi:putative 13.0 kDa protein [Frankliniella fusca]|uniref:13.0 kDa protein n=1 Tax=Frankliniella fusca TaxID=407009 RepID=A0AAE1HGJ2_9NEOP|nr:putative 13.0 kDa protein [Frankliniella fusca]KAK3920723.1 putative 13.0 kDa protein [Frankliniella fusca]
MSTLLSELACSFLALLISDQAVQKKWSQHGLMKVKKVLCTQAKDLKRSLLALALGPVEDIPQVYEDIVENLSLSMLRKAKSFLSYFQNTWLSQNNRNFKPEDWSVYGRADRTNNHVESFHSTLQEARPNIWVFLKLLVDLNVEARINYGRSQNGHQIHEKIPKKILLNDQRIANAKLLFEANRISAYTYVMWCRTAITSTLAVVRQGRRLKRYLKANFHELEYDDVPTSSDSSISYDWEYNPNPNQEERMEQEDREFDADWRQEMEENGDDEHLSVNDGASDNGEGSHVSNNGADTESIPGSDDSMWNMPEGTADVLMVRNAEEVDEAPPNVIVPIIEAAHRVPMSCIVCISELAVYIAMPCQHLLVCQNCKEALTDTCIRCKQEVQNYVTVIGT